MLAGHVGKYSRYEIERKFLLAKLPQDVPNDYFDIEDLYLFNSSLRLRTERSPVGKILQRKLTKKDKAQNQGPATSIITSLYLSESDYEALGALKGSYLHKRRYAREDVNNRITFDVFQGFLDGLVLAEVEFLTQEACQAFHPPEPSWQEVTEDPKFSGGYLAHLSQDDAGAFCNRD